MDTCHVSRDLILKQRLNPGHRGGPRYSFCITLSKLLPRMFPLKVSNTNKYFCLAAGSPVRPLQTQHRGLHTGQGNLVTRCVLTRAVNAVSRIYNICICAGIQSEEPAHDPPAGPADLGAADVRAEPPQGAGDGAADPQPRRHEGVRLQGGGGVPRVSVTISELGGGWRVVPCPRLSRANYPHFQHF